MSAEPSAGAEHPLYCFDVLASHFGLLATEPPPSFSTVASCPLFVTWKKGAADELRGCIGCLRPLPLASLRDYALTAALRDHRFTPMQRPELEQLSCTVSLLTHFEQVEHHLDWEVGVHGVMIDFVDPDGVARSAVYLPEVAAEQGWTQQQAIDSLIRKAGYRRPINPNLHASLRTTRYRSTKASASYAHWARARKLLHERSTKERVAAELRAGLYHGSQHDSHLPQAQR